MVQANIGAGIVLVAPRGGRHIEMGDCAPSQQQIAVEEAAHRGSHGAGDSSKLTLEQDGDDFNRCIELQPRLAQLHGKRLAARFNTLFGRQRH